MSELLLSRTLDPADYAHFTEELKVVDGYGTEGQHPHRRWEYALALHAIWRWKEARARADLDEPIYDVGGGGSNLYHMLGEWTDRDVAVIDPVIDGSGTLEEWTQSGTLLADVVTCISVIEHIGNLDRFLYHLSCLLAPGGLLVLTMDFWNRCGADTAANRDLRQRIFCPKTYAQLRNQLVPLHLTTFGGVDPTYHGSHVYDYTFASLVLEKRA
jgi:Methyltransferase domain